jgi:hypothetical protein
MTSTTTKPKRHRWPKHDDHDGRIECRNGDRCLDCGTYLTDAKLGGIPCETGGSDAPPWPSGECEVCGNCCTKDVCGSEGCTCEVPSPWDGS